MTDNEIIKIFEEHVQDISRLGLGGKRSKEQEAYINVMGTALDLINRQKSEIERLEEILGGTSKVLTETCAGVRVKAIKEFAERLIEKAAPYEVDTAYAEGEEIEAVEVEAIENLAKEMVGEG